MALNAAGDRLCTGTATGSVFLWDPTQSDFQAPKPLAELTSLPVPVTHILIDRFKVVTRALLENQVHVSAADTGAPICSFPPEGENPLHESRKLLVAMRGPLLVLCNFSRLLAADFSRSRLAYTGDEQKESEQGGGDELGRFWERPGENIGDDFDEN